jgi:hypothetical protein
VHHRQVETGHLGDRADDRLAVGRHGAYAETGAEQFDVRGAAEGGSDGGESPFGRVCSGKQPVRGDLPKIDVPCVDHGADQTSRGAEPEERRRRSTARQPWKPLTHQNAQARPREVPGRTRPLCPPPTTITSYWFFIPVSMPPPTTAPQPAPPDFGDPMPVVVSSHVAEAPVA